MAEGKNIVIGECLRPSEEKEPPASVAGLTLHRVGLRIRGHCSQ
jgi:hypothetical protein